MPRTTTTARALDTTLCLPAKLPLPIGKHEPPSPLIDEWVKWMPELNMRVDLTLKMRGTKIVGDRKIRVSLRLRNDEDVIATVVRAMNRLNRYILKTDRKHRRLSAVFFAERGKTNGRMHTHALIERPDSVSVEDFTNWMAKAWTDQTFGHREMKIEPIRSQIGSWIYDAKQGFQGMVYFHKDTTEAQEQD
jgi:hypothetical protein